ncbi:MAG: alanine racemase, partial [Ilumatobacteraceae bacterium]
MTLRLTIDEHAWRTHVDAVRAQVDRLVPVIKGNGYGIGRATLVSEASTWAHTIAVGTVREARDVSPADGVDVLCLTPAIELPDVLSSHVIPTVGRAEHVAALRDVGRRGRVAVKLASSMRRYGVSPDGLDDLLRDVRGAGCEPHSFMFHPPLATGGRTDDDVLAELVSWLPHLDPAIPLSVSHLSVDGWARFAGDHPERTVSLRLGTALWHGDKSAMHLDAEVL